MENRCDEGGEQGVLTIGGSICRAIRRYLGPSLQKFRRKFRRKFGAQPPNISAQISAHISAAEIFGAWARNLGPKFFWARNLGPKSGPEMLCACGLAFLLLCCCLYSFCFAWPGLRLLVLDKKKNKNIKKKWIIKLIFFFITGSRIGRRRKSLTYV